MRYLIIQGRGLGDAIITCRLIRHIKKVQPEAIVEVLCRWHNCEVFELEDAVDVVHKTSFPVNVRGFLNIIGSVLNTLWTTISLPVYDMVIDPVGGKQEFFFGSLIRSHKFISARHFEENPLHRNLIAKPGKIQNDLYIPVNYYEFIDRLAEECGVAAQVAKPPEESMRDCIDVNHDKMPVFIGIHPFGGFRWRSLSDAQILQLVQRLLVFDHYRLAIFAAPNERERLKVIMDGVGDEKNIEFHFLGLREFFDVLDSLSLMIGTDSFAVHAAAAKGIDTIFINSANDWRIWKPPQSRLVMGGGKQCPWYPCFNKPGCIGGEGEFVCISSLNIEDVVDAVKSRLNS